MAFFSWLALLRFLRFRFRGVSKKKGKWEAKVMVNRKWAYRELFDSEEDAARAYDGAVWRLKPREAKSYINFKPRGALRGVRTSPAAATAAVAPKEEAAATPMPDAAPAPPAAAPVGSKRDRKCSLKARESLETCSSL